MGEAPGPVPIPGEASGFFGVDTALYGQLGSYLNKEIEDTS